MENLLNYDRDALAGFFERRGHKRFRAEQVFHRLHGRHNPPPATLSASSLSSLTDPASVFCDLPRELREELAATTQFSPMPVASDQVAPDGVRKWLFDIGDGRIETVLIPETSRRTLCISSQAGCALACKFCLTGRQGFSRNLTAAEIIGQLRQAAALSGEKITNVVMMGMGEPLLNLDAVLPALRMMTDSRGYALSPRRVTVSTAGITPAMSRLTAEVNVSLAVSLHAPNDELRDEIMPINRKYPLQLLVAACRRHIQDRPRAFITFEYVMLRGVNDSAAQAKELVRLLHTVRCKVNLIPFNIFPDAEYQPSSKETVFAFRDVLMKKGVVTTIRKTRGDGILAACGQLAGQVRARTSGLSRIKPAKTEMKKSPESPLVRV